MQSWTPRIIILGLLALILGVPFLLRPAAATREATPVNDDPGLRLIILSPHNEQIRYEIGRAFNLWRTAQGKPAITFDWRSAGGTSDLRKQVLAQFTGLVAQNAEDTGIGIDLFFGGGEFDHNLLARGV